MIWMHAASTLVEVIGFAALWGHQGMLSPCAGRLLVLRITERLKLASLQEITADEWREVSIIAACSTVALLGLALATGMLWPGMPESPLVAVRTFFGIFVAPALIEESVFRGLLLPREGQENGASQETSSEPGSGAMEDTSDGHCAADVAADAQCTSDEETSSAIRKRRVSPVKSRPQLLYQVGALALFMVYHLDFIHSKPVFHDPRFLLMALILGISCQEVFCRTGSLWPGIFLHWIWVWGWLNFGSAPQM